MKIKSGAIAFFAFSLGLTACDEPQLKPDLPPDLLGEKIGVVDFPSGCAGGAGALVERGVAFLHHMMYANARLVFAMASKEDPNCALAYWGEAMTHIHPLWPDRPSADAIATGESLVAKIKLSTTHSDREAAYAATTGAYFQDGAKLTEEERLARFEAAWKHVAQTNPEDLEAQAFFALSQLATASPDDKSYKKQRAAGAIVESILQDSPEHPGAHHYTIHAYDSPELAPKALAVARNYGRLAPKVPHAAHMMTHTFTRLGLWDEAIEWNQTSADAAWALCLELGGVISHYQHALDYMAYAHLQKAEDEQALEIVKKAANLKAPFNDINRATMAYAFAAIPTRYALERQDWAAAASLAPKTPSSFPWDDTQLQYIAIIHFGRAMGLARLGDTAAADEEIEVLLDLEKRIAFYSAYWAKQVAVQRISAQAWSAYMDGRRDAARTLMHSAADLEATTQKSPVTPGEVLPAAELLGDMLLDFGDFAGATKAYEKALARSPGRFNSLFGAGKAAAGMGDALAAKASFEELIALVSVRAANRPRIERAKEFLSRQ
jgi:tetratricopeptide (TPR) repeat protein